MRLIGDRIMYITSLFKVGEHKGRSKDVQRLSDQGSKPGAFAECNFGGC